MLLKVKICLFGLLLILFLLLKLYQKKFIIIQTIYGVLMLLPFAQPYKTPFGGKI